MRNGIATAPLGTLPPAPTRRSWRGRASGSRGVAAIAILAVCLGLVLTELQGEIVRLRGQGAEASAAAQTIAERLSTLAAGQASLATRVDGWFDPASIVPSAEPSVFTVIAGPVLGSAFVLSSAEERSMLVTNFHVVRAMWWRVFAGSSSALKDGRSTRPSWSFDLERTWRSCACDRH